jgi:oligopeptidase B
VRHGPFHYVTRRVAGGDYWRYERTPVAGGAVQVVFDADARSKGHDYYDTSGFEVSPDHTKLAWTEDTSGDEEYRTFVLDIATGKTLAELPDANGGTVVWGADSKTLWTTKLDAAHREYQVWRHALDGSTPPVLSFEEKDERFGVSVWRSRDDRWMVLGTASSVTSEVHLLDARRPNDPWRVVEPRRDGIEYEIAVAGDRAFKRTNDGHPEFAIDTATLGAKGPGTWSVFARPTGDQTFSGVDVWARHVVVVGRAGGLPQIWIHPIDGGPGRAIAWPDAAYDFGLGSTPEPDAPALRVEYSSPVTPPVTFDVAFETGALTAVDRDAVPNFDPATMTVERLTATADDGTPIPITLVRRKDAPRPGPLLLQGYGAYGTSWDLGFVRGDLPLLERGVTLAVAHVRGGGEMGQRWHDAGKLAHKVHSFGDFIAAADHLVARGETTRERLAIMGGSAGGLLMGAVLNMRPDLCRAAVVQVPFVDVVNTMQDASLPLTAGEWDEWGDPRRAEDLAIMASYSPYDNVGAHAYPAMLVTAGFHDPRVGYWEPAKWVARMRAVAKPRGPLLFRTQMGSGHSGTTGRYGALGEQAWELVFVLVQLGLTK